MTILTNFLRSLLLTIILSFVAPMFLVGAILLILSLIDYIPGLQGAGEAIANHILQFLVIFGSGTAFRGLFVISLTCGFVGGLFDTYAYYRCQILR
ncbi:hypothetical protein ACF3DV_15905 [Chlorogloeopsis fritschii PCC 9212]|uniref:Uncharacterized protein n=1 Tax=Chlorogloeopsis fritschii PCC 6912 TaxID=211165 RepID=A0A3S0Y1I4_CHLFR|nr:hypothetical protein [Chlorogloeopsis fritschii]MBF2004303.1 hypothetical protein [Chlorogloeopsis fritschii C42_A2020_084]RUR83339.1 hypothetical protein PCC6912_21720 [Chlorogloeopsis fritschii PCC 6912]